MPATPTVSKAQQKAIQKADTLIEALGWIRKFRDTTTVIKLGGSVVEHPDSLRHLLLDMRTPAAAELGGPPAPPGSGASQQQHSYYMLLDMVTTQVLSFRPAAMLPGISQSCWPAPHFLHFL